MSNQNEQSIRQSRHPAMHRLSSWMAGFNKRQAWVAGKVGVTRGHLSNLLNGYSRPSESVIRLSEALMSGAPISATDDLVVPTVTEPPPTRRRPTVNAIAAESSGRQLNESELQCVAQIAKAWCDLNRSASTQEFVGVVKAIVTGIRG